MSPIEKYNRFVMEEIDQNSLESLKLFVQVFITMKMTQNDSPHIKILENHILKVEIDSYGWGHNSADLFTFDRLNLEISNGLSSSNQPLNNLCRAQPTHQDMILSTRAPAMLTL